MAILLSKASVATTKKTGEENKVIDGFENFFGRVCSRVLKPEDRKEVMDRIDEKAHAFLEEKGKSSLTKEQKADTLGSALTYASAISLVEGLATQKVELEPIVQIGTLPALSEGYEFVTEENQAVGGGQSEPNPQGQQGEESLEDFLKRLNGTPEPETQDNGGANQ